MNDILLTLALVLAGAEIGAVIASSVRLPRAVGQIAAGLILGPSLLGVVSASPIVAALAEIGALCILAIAGLETNRILMRKVGRAALLAAFGGVLLPFCGGAVGCCGDRLGPAGGTLRRGDPDGDERWDHGCRPGRAGTPPLPGRDGGPRGGGDRRRDRAGRPGPGRCRVLCRCELAPVHGRARWP